MGLLAPWFLAGLAALSLPLWLHLLRRHNSPLLRFSSVMLFESSPASSARRRRLDHLLLLAARCAVLLLLVLAFAGPYVRRQAPEAAGAPLVVVAIDNSLSMGADGRLEQARREALQLVAGLPQDRQAIVISFARTATLLAGPVNDAGALAATLRSVEISDSAGSYGELMRAVRSLATSGGPPVELHLFSDLQRTSLPPGFQDLALPAGARLVIHRAGSETPANWTVESARAPVRVFGSGGVRVEATVAGYSHAGRTLGVEIRLNGRTLETRQVNVPAFGRAVVAFSPVEAPFGNNRVELALTSHDALAGDDVLRLAITRAEPTPVLFVHRPQETRSPLYFRAALESASGGAYRVETVSAGQLGPVDPSGYPLVVLSDTGTLPSAWEKALRRHIENGHGLLIALGISTSALRAAPVSGRAIGGARSFSRQAERFERAGWIDSAHPVLERAGRWDAVRFYHAAELNTAGGRILARSPDELPLLVEEELGRGRVLTLASGLDNVTNDLPVRPAFVPFVEQACRYLSGASGWQAQGTVDSRLPLRASSEPAAAYVLDPDGRRALTLSEASRADSFQFTRAGFWEVQRPDGRRQLIGINADRRESDLTVAPEDALAMWRNTAAPSAGEHAPGRANQQQVQLGWYLLAALLVAALAESLLSHRYLRSARESV